MIRGLWNLLVSLFCRDRGAVAGKARSAKWAATKRRHLLRHPACAMCGSRKKVQVHHVLPYHSHPEMELRRSNLITLCSGKYNCHLLAGHLGDYSTSNPLVRLDARVWRAKLRHRGLTKRRTKR